MSSTRQPPAASSSTSVSREVRGLSPALMASAANCGSTYRPPPCTVRMTSASTCAETVFGTNPPTPAANARLRWPGLPWLVTIRLAQSGSSDRNSSATAMLSRPGICRFSTATSGRCRRAMATASVPRRRLGDHLEIGLHAEQRGDRDTDEILVVGEQNADHGALSGLSLIHISEPTRRTPISYAVFC